MATVGLRLLNPSLDALVDDLVVSGSGVQVAVSEVLTLHPVPQLATNNILHLSRRQRLVDIVDCLVLGIEFLELIQVVQSPAFGV
jgi:hypothetical protein